MEKEVKKWSSNTRVSLPKPAMNTAEQANQTKPERRLVSFAADMMVPAEEGESLPAKIQEHKYEEADLNRGLELYKTYKKRSSESGLEQLSFDDLLVLANTASFALTGQVSKEVVVPVGFEAASLKVVKPNRDPSDACAHTNHQACLMWMQHIENKGCCTTMVKLSQNLNKANAAKAQDGDETEATAAAVSRKKTVSSSLCNMGTRISQEKTQPTQKKTEELGRERRRKGTSL